MTTDRTRWYEYAVGYHRLGGGWSVEAETITTDRDAAKHRALHHRGVLLSRVAPDGDWQAAEDGES